MSLKQGKFKLEATLQRTYIRYLEKITVGDTIYNIYLKTQNTNIKALYSVSYYYGLITVYLTTQRNPANYQ